MQKQAELVVITGAAGGMGRACARRMGSRYSLLLLDIKPDTLKSTAHELRDEGFEVETYCADLTDPGAISAFVGKARSLGPLKALIHTAGISPTMGNAERIMAVNWTSTYNLTEAFLPLTRPGSSAVLIASMAGHVAKLPENVESLLDNPNTADFWSKISAYAASPEASYGISKRAVIRYCERVVGDWAERGARIVSISPGSIDTPMGRLELENQPLMVEMLHKTPLKRLGTADDIAAATEFLCSEAASYITGTDLRIDGGITPFWNRQLVGKL